MRPRPQTRSRAHELTTTGDQTRVARVAHSARARELHLRVSELIRELDAERAVCAGVQRDLAASARRLAAELEIVNEECNDLATQLEGASRRVARLDTEIHQEQEHCAMRELELSSVDRHIDRLTRESESLHTDSTDLRSSVHHSRERCQSAVGAVHRMDHKLRAVSGAHTSRPRDGRDVRCLTGSTTGDPRGSY